MKIGIDARFWNESGVGRYIRNLVRELNKTDTKNEYVLFLSNESRVTNQEFKGNWKIVRTNIRWHSFEEQIKFPLLLNKYNLDLVHFPYFSIPVFYNRPFVVTIHDLILHHFQSGKASTLPLPIYRLKILGYKFVMHVAAKRASEIISVSESTKKEIVEHLGVTNDKITVTYEGVDGHIKGDEKQNLGEYFLYVGNTYPHKNLDMLLYAFSALADTRAKLIIVGKKDYFQARLKDRAKKDFRNPNIEFYEEVDDAQLSSLYSGALALVSPSLMEGFGLPLIEAMQYNCVVLASDIRSSREICKEAALYFDPRKRDDLAQKMQSILDNKISLDKYRKKGLAQVKSFSWEKMGQETLQVYNNCLSKRIS